MHAGSGQDLSQEDAQQLERSVQIILDDYRAKDIAAAEARYAATPICRP